MRIGLGCVQLGSASAREPWRNQVTLVRQAVDSGVTLFDTADAYGSGSSERVLGQALKGRRDEVVIATKGGYVFRPRSPLEQRARQVVVGLQRRLEARRESTASAGMMHASAGGHGSYVTQDFAPSHVTAALDASLRRLDTDYIDVYQFHGPSEVYPQAAAALTKAKQLGKIRAVGVGCETIDAALAWCEVDEVDTLQIPFGVLDPTGVNEIVARCAGAGTSVPELWARAVLGGGVLAAAIADSQSSADHPKRRVIDKLVAIARERAMGLDELAVRWVTGHDAVSTMLVGSSRLEHILRNLELAQSPPLPEDMQATVTSALADLPHPDSKSA